MNEQTRKRLETARAAREGGQPSPTTAKIRPTDTTAAGITSAAPSSVAPPPTPAPKRNRATDPTPNELAARQRQRDRKSSINPTPAEAAHRERLRDRYSTRHRQRAFLHAIIQTFGNASAAAKMADVKIENHYRWRRSSERYRRALKAALKRAAQQRLEAAESKLYRKAVLGWNERTTTTVHGKDGTTTTIKERNMEDTTALIFLLKALDPGKYRERTETVVNANVNASIDHTGGISIAAVRQSLLEDDEFIEFQRWKAIRADQHAGLVCADGERRPLGNGPTSSGS